MKKITVLILIIAMLFMCLSCSVDNGIDYYEIKDEPLWITKKIVEKSGTYYTIYYEVDSVTSLPLSILISTADS